MGYSSPLSADPALGRVDFVYVEGETAERLFSELQDLADIRYLLGLPDLDLESVRQSFARHGRLATYDQLLQSL